MELFMPVMSGRDNKGRFYRWGNSGKKYYYTDEKSKQRAKIAAQKQGIAAYSSGYREWWGIEKKSKAVQNMTALLDGVIYIAIWIIQEHHIILKSRCQEDTEEKQGKNVVNCW